MAVMNSNRVVGGFTFRGGVHPPHRKNFSEAASIKQVEIPDGATVVVPMIQHIGVPNTPTVEKKQEVTVGQPIGVCEAFVSASVHSPVNGIVQNVAPMSHPMGKKVLSVVIKASGQQPASQQWRSLPAEFNAQAHSVEQIIDAIGNAGIVGQGGAAFPATVKLKINPKKPVNTILVNGCECEPYLTSDHRLMIEAPGPIITGLQLAMRASGAAKGIITIEDNKPDAIESVKKALDGVENIQLAICKTKYPQGGEKQLINAVLKRVVPTGGLPLDVGVVVANVGTLSSIAWAVVENRPVTQRIVTVTGAGIKSPGNFRVPVGMMLADLIELAGGLTDDAAKVLLGGPMMGPSTPTLDVPILKGTSGITVMTENDVKLQEIKSCIRCGRCVDTCPVKLVPTRIAHAVKARDIQMALDYDLLACMECGCCTYVCPSQIPLLQYLRAGKQLARELKK